MSITCEKTFILQIASGCPTPTTPVFTVPATPTATIADSIGSYFFSGVYNTRKAVSAATNTLTGTMGELDFAAGTRTSLYPVPSETGWATSGSIYEPTTGLIVSMLYKAATTDKIAFIDPSGGTVTAIDATTTARPYWACTLMRGQPGKVAFMEYASAVGADSHLYIVNAATQTIETTFIIDGGTATIRPGHFCYGCATGEFYTNGYMGDLSYRIIRISATDGTPTATSITAAYPMWVDSSNKLAVLRSGDDLIRYNPSDWSVELTTDLYTLTGLPYVVSYTSDIVVGYIYKLDCIVIPLRYETSPIAPFDESAGFGFFKASDFSYVGVCKTNSSYLGVLGYLAGFNETTGSVIGWVDDGSHNFHEITPTII